MQALRLSEPLVVGGLTLKNRVATAPMERNYCELDGRISERYLAYLEARARGGVALVNTEASFVRADGKGRARQMGIHSDEMIPGLAELAARIHRHDAKLAVEINHGGRTAQARVSGFQPVAPTPIPCEVAGGDLPLELDEDDIEHLITCYGDATRRCAEAGVDVVELHAGHGYLVHQFLSSRTNRRTDQWAEPTRFFDAVLGAMRAAAGSMVIGVRLSAFEGALGGIDADTTFSIFQRSQLGTADFIDVSAGSYEGREWIVQPGEFAQGFLRPFAARYRTFGKPLGVAGRINSVATAEAIIASGDADVVTMARAHHADPEWTNKVLAGREPRPCIACNLCIDQLGGGEPIPCSVNPDVGREYLRDASVERPRSSGSGHSAAPAARVTVIGAGPAGLETARALASSGITVTLVEKEWLIGGQFALAAGLNEYPEYQRILDWYRDEIARLGVHLQLGFEATGVAIASSTPHAIVVATGADGFVPRVAGRELSRVVDIREWIRAAVPVESTRRYTIWGGDREAVAVADDIHHRGGRLLIIGGGDELAADVGARAKILVLPRLLASESVEVHLNANVLEIRPTTVVIDEAGGVVTLDSDGPFIVSQGVVAQSTLVEICRQLAPVGGTYCVGDAAGRGGLIAECVADGAATAREILSSLPSALTASALP